MDIDEIDTKDERFRTSWAPPSERMMVSLREIGLLQPPLVQKRGGRNLLVSGWKRILACRALSLSPIEVMAAERKNDLAVFLLGFFENLATRDFPFVEKAEIAFRLKKFGEPEERLIAFYLPLLGIHPTASHLRGLLSLSRFERAEKDRIAAIDIHPKSIERLLEFRSEERALVLPLLAPLSHNSQKELLEDLFEVTRRDDETVKDFLESEEIRGILESDRLSPLQKSEKSREALRKKRYPVFSRWSESFESSARKLPWPNGVRVKPSPFFEEDQLSLTFRFKTKKDFQAGLAKLQKLASRQGFSDLFRRT